LTETEHFQELEVRLTKINKGHPNVNLFQLPTRVISTLFTVLMTLIIMHGTSGGTQVFKYQIL